MSTELAHYSPEDITVIVAGFINITGFIDGTFVTINKMSQTFTQRESADGVPSRTMKSSQMFRVTLTLSNYSDSNQGLTYLSRLDELTYMGRFPMIIKDQLGTSLFFAPECWITSIPDVTYSNGIESRNWEIICANSVNNVGGNYEQSGLLGDILNIGSGYLGGVV